MCSFFPNQVAHKKTEGESKYGALSSSSALRQEFLARMQTEAEEPWVKLSWSEMNVSHHPCITSATQSYRHIILNMIRLLCPLAERQGAKRP
jgi:hypothetical protein